MINLIYFGINFQNTNPTHSLFKNIFETRFNVLNIGPGFGNSMSLILEKKIDKIIENFDPKIIMMDMHSFGYDEWKKKRLPKFFFIKEIKIYNKYINEFIKNIKVPFIIYCDTDFYFMPINIIEKLIYNNCFVISPDSNFFSEEGERDISYKQDADYNNYEWVAYLKKKFDKVISLPHCLHEDEFFNYKKINKSIDVSILGAKYSDRLHVLKILKEERLKICSDDFKRKTIHQALKFLSPFSKFSQKYRHYLINFYNSGFRNTISKSKISYTCGGIDNFVVRKFLEIPAFASLLICKKFKNFENFGFIPHVNSIPANLNEVKDLVHFYLNNHDKRNLIISKGQDFLLKKHSFSARKKQFFSSFELIIKNKFKGSRWVKGNFELI